MINVDYIKRKKKIIFQKKNGSSNKIFWKAEKYTFIKSKRKNKQITIYTQTANSNNIPTISDFFGIFKVSGGLSLTIDEMNAVIADSYAKAGMQGLDSKE